MTKQPLPLKAAAAALACIIIATTGSCRRADRAGPQDAPSDAVIAPELMTNQLGTLAGAVYQSQSFSPIRWQPWTRESFERARAARRLVFCVVAIPQHPGFVDVLKAMESDANLVETLNEEYVPVLVDADAAREMGIITSQLCAEINRPVNWPLLLWLTHEANPVAWLPVSANDVSKFADLFAQSHSVISQTWHDDPSYVIKNSRLDNETRLKRFESRKNDRVVSKEPAADLLRGLRKLTSLYDPLTRMMDETGGLLPTSALELMAAAAVHPGLPADLREACLVTTRELTKDVTESAMFDPLDGGVFSVRRSASWAMPNFIKDCITHARMATALLYVYRATGDRRALERALGLIAHAEENFATPDGLFAMGFTPPTPAEAWMWSLEDVRELLGPEDAEWWIEATGMKGLGNLPSEVDPRREFFRSNTLSMPQEPARIAAAMGISPDDFQARFDAARQKLLEARKKRLGRIQRDGSPHAQATLRMVSAHAAAFRATGEEAHRDKAVSLLERARTSFTEGRHLRAFVSSTPPSVGVGRNFLYGLAMQAALDVSAITSDEKWLLWSEDLATTAAELFTGDGLLKECPDDAGLMNLPIADQVMLFDDSSAGLISAAECRLRQIGRPLLDAFSALATEMPIGAHENPVLHTDLFLAALARHFSITAVYGDGLPPAMKTAVERLPLRMVQRRKARDGEDIPPGAVELQFGLDGRKILAKTPGELAQAILPDAGSPRVHSIGDNTPADADDEF
jgi:uncharacterized protein YyaL (SSP411 family)